MKILVISDTHGDFENFNEVLKKVGEVDMILHLGDLESSETQFQSMVSCAFNAVSGNCDLFSKLEKEKLITIENRRILMVHGHRFGVHAGIDTLSYYAESKNADIVLFGHTHVPLLTTAGKVVVCNPGSLRYPRQEGRVPTYCIMESDGKGDFSFSMETLW